MSGFFAADAHRWPVTLEKLQRLADLDGEPLDQDTIVLDLQWWADQERLGVKIPGRRELRKRWRCSDWTARQALGDEHLWRRHVESLPLPSRLPPTSLPPASRRETVKPSESRKTLPTASQSPPASLPLASTRAETDTDHRTPTPYTDPPAPQGGGTADAAPVLVPPEAEEKPRRRRRGPPEVTPKMQRIWTHYRAQRIAAGHGTDRIGDTPPADFLKPLANTCADRDEDDIVTLIDWWFTGPNDWWRQKRSNTPTIFFGDTWTKTWGDAAAWHEAGRPTSAQARASPSARRPIPDRDDLNRQALALLQQETTC